jgi:hypothetical protein
MANAGTGSTQVRKSFLFWKQSLFRTRFGTAKSFSSPIKDNRPARQSNDETKDCRPGGKIPPAAAQTNLNQQNKIHGADSAFWLPKPGRSGRVANKNECREI